MHVFFVWPSIAERISIRRDPLLFSCCLLWVQYTSFPHQLTHRQRPPPPPFLTFKVWGSSISDPPTAKKSPFFHIRNFFFTRESAGLRWNVQAQRVRSCTSMRLSENIVFTMVGNFSEFKRCILLNSIGTPWKDSSLKAKKLRKTRCPLYNSEPPHCIENPIYESQK
jgi:hypothetical protein